MRLFFFFLILAPSILFAQIDKEIHNIFSFYKYYPQTPNGYTPLPLSNNFIYKKKNTLIEINPQTNESTIFVTIPDSLSFRDFIVSPNKKELLLKSDIKAIFRRSQASKLHKYSIASNTWSAVKDNSDSLLVPAFSPKGTYVSYIYNNNLFIENSKGTKQVTFDGEKNQCINGMSDWVYEEEFMLTKAYCWSPDEKNICYLKFNESNVKEYSLTYYDSVYPTTFTYKYPKVGEKNSTVSICLYNVDKDQTKHITLPHEYIYAIQWENTNNFFIVQALNRFQDSMFVYAITSDNLKPKLIYRETSDTYVEFENYFTSVNDSICYFTSEKSGRNHIYSLNTFTGTEKQLTRGNWDVTDIYGISDENTIYFQSTLEGKLNRSIQKISLFNKPKPIKINKQKGFNSAVFNSNFSYFIHSYSTSNTVNTYSFCSNNGTYEHEILNNNSFQLEYDKREIYKEFSDIITNNGDTISVCIISKSQKKKNSPVLIKVYGGPGYQTIKNKWDYSDYWNDIFLSKGFIIVQVDPRGSFGFGCTYKKQTYKQLGLKEKDDILFVANKIAKEKWCDKNNISIFGWSYGGYMSLFCMTDSISIIRNAVSVAPITNWKYYDNAYTERYMQTPETNKEGYEQTNINAKTGSLHGNILLIHGLYDDNVHPQHSTMFIDSMIEKGKYIDYNLIPNKNHSMIGSRAYIYQLITDWILEKSIQ